MTQMAQHPQGDPDLQAEPGEAEASSAADSEIDAMTLPQLDAEIGRLRDRELELRRLRSRPEGLTPTQRTEEASLGMRLRALRRARSLLSSILGVPRIRTRRAAG